MRLLSIATLKVFAATLYAQADRSLELEINKAFDSIGFTDKYVSDSIAANASGPENRKDKVVKDNIWGMVELDWSTIRLLDSPILQRLRGIRQLGFSYLTYPTAEHSRFVHSLGMTCVVRRFIDAMQRNGESEKLNDNEIKSALHAAVLHDTGHMPFSHALESAYHDGENRHLIGKKTVRQFVGLFKDELEHDFKLGECLSLAIILSPRFRHFYNQYVCGDPGADPERIYRIACLISGLPHDPDFPGLANIISDSSVDADKIDYINRDSTACGIAVGLDVARLFLRSEFKEISGEQITSLFVGRAPTDKLKVFIVNSSGADTIEEIAIAKASLYQRVYFHQTTRSAERILSKAIRLYKATRRPNISRPLEAWAMDDISLLRQLTEASETATLGWRLRNRDLPKRACVFGRDATEVHIRPSQLFKTAASDVDRKFVAQVTGAQLEKFRKNALYGDELDELEGAVKAEVIRLRDLLKPTGLDRLPQEAEPGLLTVLAMPNLTLNQPDAIIRENNELLHTPKKSSVDELSDASEMFKSSGYVMTTSQWRELTLIAARKVFAEAFSGQARELTIALTEEKPLSLKVIPNLMLNLDIVSRRAGLKGPNLDAILNSASKLGYFDDNPLLAKRYPKPDARALASRLDGFNGEGSWIVTPESIASFLSQFPPRLREEAAELLNRVEMIDRAAIGNAVISLVEKAAPTSAGRWLTHLSPNSGSNVRMLAEQERMQDLKSAGWISARSLTDALNKSAEGSTILLIDDCAVSGVQASAQLLAWFGKPREQWPAECRTEANILDAALDENGLSKLKACRVVLGFVTSDDAAKTRILQVAGQLGLNQIDVIWAQDLARSQATMSSDLQTFLERVGHDVIKHYRASRGANGDPEEQEKDAWRDALGYSGTRCLLTTIFNVPTSTITALWCPGMVNGRPWVPLFIRRGYLSNLILH